jgi:hypothetical protein
LKKKEYERQYDELYRKLEHNRDQQWEFQQLQTRVYDEEDANDASIRPLREFAMDMEEDWKSRNLMGNHDYLIDDNLRVLNNINTERSYLWNEDKEMKSHLRKLRYEEEGYEEEMARLTRRYDEEKEEEHGQDY